jgi:hypothetical protein
MSKKKRSVPGADPREQSEEIKGLKIVLSAIEKEHLDTENIEVNETVSLLKQMIKERS